MKVTDIRKGDIVTYRNRRVNNVNKPERYWTYFDNDFKNINYGRGMEIMKIQRYVKFLCFYRLKTIYKRVEK